MQPDSKRIAVPSATRIRQLASGIVVGAAALGAEIELAEIGAFGQPRARPSRLQRNAYVAASRSGARARCSFTSHLHGPRPSGQDMVTLGVPLSHGPRRGGRISRVGFVKVSPQSGLPARRSYLAFICCDHKRHSVCHAVFG